ncbi:MAG TPA: MogA/MoaB family molybdenum cofactor biosynthesis protein [Acidobacteriota bacterium]|nr:MogA/MoaB family molybdenum cofactor biosynthesis protein [Acidobacteriota bacterium]
MKKLRTAILTVSDGCFHGQRDDLSGQALAEEAESLGWVVKERQTVPDEPGQIGEVIRSWAGRDDLDLLLSTGGTGLGPRDVTPEAVQPLLDRTAAGLAELMRAEGLKKTPFAALSRSLAGTLNGKVVLCLPGSPKGALESLQAVQKLLPHAVDLAQGRTGH